MKEVTSLRDHFLISMPHLMGDSFSHSLTYICDHGEHGAMGIIINRPISMSVQELFGYCDIDAIPSPHHQQNVFMGGPVQSDRGFVLHRNTGRKWLSTHLVTSDICMTTSNDILSSIAVDDMQADYLVALGYAGWAPGQLEDELYDNIWLSCPANSDILFRLPAEERLQAAAASFGVNLQRLTAHVGHA